MKHCDYLLNYQLKYMFWVPKELSHPDGSYEYQQQMCLVENKKIETGHEILVLSYICEQ